MDFEVRDRAVYLSDLDVLVCADLHVGKVATSNVEIGLGERRDLVDRFVALCDRYRPREVVVAGDLLHSFGTIPSGVPETVHELRETVGNFETDVIVTRGNHDPMLSELWDGSIDDVCRYEFDDGEVVVTHGDVLPQTDADVYVIGHDHPTIEIEGRRHPCYLLGRSQYGGADLLMVPAFGTSVSGVAINSMSTSDFQSPLVTDADDLRPIVCDPDGGDSMEFPPLGTFRDLL